MVVSSRRYCEEFVLACFQRAKNDRQKKKTVMFSVFSFPLRLGMAKYSFVSSVSYSIDARAETRLESFLQVLCSVAIPL